MEVPPDSVTLAAMEVPPDSVTSAAMVPQDLEQDSMMPQVLNGLMTPDFVPDSEQEKNKQVDEQEKNKKTSITPATNVSTEPEKKTRPNAQCHAKNTALESNRSIERCGGALSSPARSGCRVRYSCNPI
jgi:hypothetical protein